MALSLPCNAAVITGTILLREQGNTVARKHNSRNMYLFLCQYCSMILECCTILHIDIHIYIYTYCTILIIIVHV
jgi:hypothetical protein